MLNSLFIAIDRSSFGKFPKTRLQGTISDVINIPIASNLSLAFSTSLSSWSFIVHNFDDRQFPYRSITTAGKT